MNISRKSIFFLFLVIFWITVIYALSDMSSLESNKKSKEIVNQIVDKKGTNKENNVIVRERVEKFNKVFRKFAHASVYFVLCILVLKLIFNLKGNEKYIYYLISIIFCFIYACTDEFHQLFVDGRTGQFIDVLIDTIGAIIGCLTYLLFKRIKVKRNLAKNIRKVK